jgi:PAS domain S-box-containing protein
MPPKESVVAVFGSVARGFLRATLPTHLQPPTLAAGAFAIVLLALAVEPFASRVVTTAVLVIACILFCAAMVALIRPALDSRIVSLPRTSVGYVDTIETESPRILENAPDGILVTNGQLRVRIANRAARRLAGMPETMQGAAIRDVLRTPGGDAVDRSFLELSKAQPVTLDIIRGDGASVPVEVTFAALRGGAYQFILRDGTARRQAEAELRRSRAQLQRLTRRLSASIEEERRRIAREVHDELGQQLVRLKQDVAWLRARTASTESAERLAALGEVLDETNAIVRRIASELRPSVLDDLGLSAAVEWQVLDFGRRTGLSTSLSLDESADALGNAPATALFRILQEALTNVAKHASASRLNVRLERRDGEVWLEIADDGRGIRPADMADPSRLGLLGMRERADAFGGTVGITALPDVGTTVVVRLPVAPVSTMRIA